MSSAYRRQKRCIFFRRTRSVNGEVVLTINTYLPAARFSGIVGKEF